MFANSWRNIVRSLLYGALFGVGMFAANVSLVKLYNSFFPSEDEYSAARPDALKNVIFNNNRLVIGVSQYSVATEIQNKNDSDLFSVYVRAVLEDESGLLGVCDTFVVRLEANHATEASINCMSMSPSHYLKAKIRSLSVEQAKIENKK